MKSFLKFVSIFILIILVLTTGLGIYIYSQFQPVNTKDTSVTQFVIPKGQAVSVIASRLKTENLIKNALAFRVLVKYQQLESQIQAGSFELTRSMSVKEIATSLTQGTNDLWVTIPEGWRVEEIAQMLTKQGLSEFDSDEFIALAKSEEGYLFPDTYLIPKLATHETIYQLLRNTFDKKITQGLSEEIAASKQSLTENLIMASIVEREARGDEQMRQVAGILWHRIDIGMALQTDATLQYAKGYSQTEKSWWTTPTSADRSVASPFNTYLNPGLPPRPICNPGLSAIKAVLDPAATTNLFYLHDRTGEIHYAATLEEHDSNIEKYLR